jgi:hypothetical protein
MSINLIPVQTEKHRLKFVLEYACLLECKKKRLLEVGGNYIIRTFSMSVVV